MSVFASERGGIDHPVIRTASEGVLVFATGPFSSISATLARTVGDVFEPLPTFTPDDLNNNLGSGVVFRDASVLFSYYSVSVPQPSTLWAMYVHMRPGAELDGTATPTKLVARFGPISQARLKTLRPAAIRLTMRWP